MGGGVLRWQVMVPEFCLLGYRLCSVFGVPFFLGHHLRHQRTTGTLAPRGARHAGRGATHAPVLLPLPHYLYQPDDGRAPAWRVRKDLQPI